MSYWGVSIATTWLPYSSYIILHRSYSDHCCVTASLSHCSSVGTYGAQTTPQVYKAEGFHLYPPASVSQIVLWLHLSHWLPPPLLSLYCLLPLAYCPFALAHCLWHSTYCHFASAHCCYCVASAYAVEVVFIAVVLLLIAVKPLLIALNLLLITLTLLLTISTLLLTVVGVVEIPLVALSRCRVVLTISS